jgi:hypothetical protein
MAQMGILSTCHIAYSDIRRLSSDSIYLLPVLTMRLHLLKQTTLFLSSLLILYILSIGVLAYFPPRSSSIIERTIGRPLQPGGRGQSLARFREAEQYGPVDIVFAGSSHAMRGFDPRCFAEASFRSFNLGSRSQSPMNSFYLMQRYWAKLRPRLVIYEIYPKVFTTDGIESFYDLATNTSLSRETISMALATRQMRPINVLLALQWRRLTQPLEQHSQRSIVSESYTSGGYSERQGNFDTSTPIDPTSWDLDDAQLNYLRKLIRFVHANDAQIMLVSLPITKELRDNVINYANATARIQAIAKDEGITYIDLNQTLTLHSSQYFFDDDHLNGSGARITSGTLIEILEQQHLPGVIPSYRGAERCGH